MVGEVTINNALGQQRNTANSSASLTADFSQFLTLLTTQLQNQDPLSPIDSTEFTNQLVAFSGVEQQINTNQKLDSIVSLNIGTAFSASQNYVGQDVSYVSSEFDYTGAPSELRYSLQGTAVLSKINITNEQGDVVFTEDVPGTFGAHEYVWNGTLNSGGKATPGTYEIHIDALDASNDPVLATTVVRGHVRGTETQNGQIFLLIGQRAVSLSNILNTSESSTLSNNNDSLTSALGYIGLDITYLNDEFNFDGATPVDIAYDLSQNADRAMVLIKNDIGETIYTAEIDTGEGLNNFTWDGKLSDGTTAPASNYTFVIDALDANDDPIASTSIATGVVTGIESIGGQTFLNVGLTSVSLADVLSADVPEDPPGTV